MPERMGRDFAELVASEFESALARDPQLVVEPLLQVAVVGEAGELVGDGELAGELDGLDLSVMPAVATCCRF